MRTKALILATVSFALGALIFGSGESTTPVWAMAATGNPQKSIATVPLDDGMEAIVTVDHDTCEMTGYVIDRFTGKFFLQYRYNLAQDFRVRRGRSAQFLMVPGRATFRQFTGNERLANGVLYVTEKTSGQLIAYGIPWNTQFRANVTRNQTRNFVPLDRAKTRNAPLPDEQ